MTPVQLEFIDGVSSFFTNQNSIRCTNTTNCSLELDDLLRERNWEVGKISEI